MNVALAEVRSRRLTGAFARLATPGVRRVKIAPIWTFSSVNAVRAHHQTSTVSFKQAEEKKQSFKAMLGEESASKKYRKQRFLHDRTAGMPRTSCPGRNNTIGLLFNQECRFQVCFWQPKTLTSRCAPGAGWGCQGTNTRQIPAWGSSTPQHGQKRRRGKDEDFLVQKSLTLWPPKFTVRSERNVFPSSFSCFLFFFLVARLPVGENTSFLPCGSNTSSAQGRRASVALICLHCSKEGMFILAKQCVSSERCAMPKACSVCHHGNKVEQTQQTKLPCKMLVWSSSSTWQVVH